MRSEDETMDPNPEALQSKIFRRDLFEKIHNYRSMTDRKWEKAGDLLGPS